MNKADRIRAFSMRCDGMTWREIGRAMNYDGQTIAKDLHTVLEKRRRIPEVRYPAIKEFMLQECSGSLSALAARMGVSPHRLRRVLVHGDPLPAGLRRKLLEATGLNAEAAFAERRPTMHVKPPLRDSQDDTPAACCELCQGEVYREETVFEWNGKQICSDCFKFKVGAWLDDSPEQVAGALGFPHRRADEPRKEAMV